MPGGKKGRYAPPVHMIKLTETSEIAPFVWVHPDEGGRRFTPAGSFFWADCLFQIRPPEIALT